MDIIMEIKRSSRVDGFYMQPVPGQARYYYSHSDLEEFYEIPGWLENGGYQGSCIHFFDLKTGMVQIPFPKERNVLYGDPIFCDGYLWFLQGDFNQRRITLFRYTPGLPGVGQNDVGQYGAGGHAPGKPVLGGCCTPVFQQTMDAFDLYNLHLIGAPVHIISQNGKITCYYPQAFECPLAPNESLVYIEHGRLYFNAWVEEGVENDTVTDRYKYYDKLVVKDIQGNVLSEEKGCLCQFPDGSWWLT